MLSAAGDSVILWDTTNWTRYRTLNAGPGVEAAEFVGSEWIAVLFRDDSLMMWHIKTFQVKCRLTIPENEHAGGLKCFSVSADQLTVVAAGHSPLIFVWEVESQQLIRVIEVPSSVRNILHLRFMPNSDPAMAKTTSVISVLGDDGRISYLNVRASNPQINMQVSAEPRGIVAYAIDAAGHYIVSGTSDGCLLIHDLDIARDFALQVKRARKTKGIPTVDKMDELSTRSAFAIRQAEPTFDETDQITENPASDDEEDDGPIRKRTSSMLDTAFGTMSKSKKSTRYRPPMDTAAKHATSVYHLAQLTEAETRVSWAK